MACDRVSIGIATEEGKYNAEVKEDKDVETGVVEGADSPLIDKVGPCGPNESEMLLSILQGMFEDKPSRKQTEKEGKTSLSRPEWRRTTRREEKRRKWLTQPSMKKN